MNDPNIGEYSLLFLFVNLRLVHHSSSNIFSFDRYSPLSPADFFTATYVPTATSTTGQLRLMEKPNDCFSPRDDLRWLVFICL